MPGSGTRGNGVSHENHYRTTTVFGGKRNDGRIVVSAGQRMHQSGRFGCAPRSGLGGRRHTSARARGERSRVQSGPGRLFRTSGYPPRRQQDREAALDEPMIEEFVQHLNRCRCPRYGRTHRRDLRKGARLFLRYARFADIVMTRAVEENIVDPALLVSFGGWMRQQRGTCEATLYNYNLHLRDLLKSLGEDPDRFDAQNLRQFILDTSQRSGWASAKQCTTAVRMFLRFLIADGKCAAGLEGSIPVLAHWRLSSLPRYLQSDEVELVIASCDPATPVGKPDRAILLLLARLGLRAGDLVQLRLGDIDWKESGISVSGKGRRQTLMPLTQEIGDALASYIKDDRPQTAVDGSCCRRRGCQASNGIWITKVAPAPARDSKSIRPPCFCTMTVWAIVRPCPDPFPTSLVVKNGLKILE